MRTTDYNGKEGKAIKELLSENEVYDIKDLDKIANIQLDKIKLDDNHNLLIFPQNWNEYRDNIHKKTIFSLSDKNIKTHSIMGFVGRNKTQLTISSRFSKKDKHDYFLHYMLQKVFSINILKFDQTPNKENIWDFLLYLFPYYLKKAYLQGLYKAYKREEYNDANVKGTIDVKRHIRINIPFSGKIAYTTREHSHDNAVNQLIRHTIEHIKTHPFGSGILTSDSGTRDIVSKFCFVTQNSYNKNARQKIIAANLKPVSHPYFTEYKILQKICLRILQREKLTFGAENDKIYGLLFDGAWLWEEYIATILKEKGIEHRTTIKDKLFVNSITQNQGIIPDFICPIKNTKNASFIGDAKYKHIDTKNNREDYFQIITYMFRYSCPKGYIIFPFDKDIENSDFLRGRERDIDNESNYKVIELGIEIPQKVEDFIDFQNQIRKNEQSLNFLKSCE